MPIFHLVQTDNFDGDYPDESFVTGLPYFSSKENAQEVADLVNSVAGGVHSNRFWKVVEENYILAPGFEP